MQSILQRTQRRANAGTWDLLPLNNMGAGTSMLGELSEH